ncbi:unnamed protein product [Anisakis simplex]|nr:unnamed protein product [Anisakis simplex]
MPKIFHVNWFRRDKDGGFLWPGFGDNIRVVDWIIRRLGGDASIAQETPIGFVPKKGSLNLEGLKDIKYDELMSVPKDYWQEDVQDVKNFFDQQVPFAAL